MPLYESVVIARQDLATTQVDALADELTNIISEGGGKVAKRENWGLTSLTYRIKKNRKGHYVLFNIDAPAATINEYERRMRINENVLRYLTIRVDIHEEGPSAILQHKDRLGSERGGFVGSARRGGRDDGDRGRDGERFSSGRRPRPSEDGKPTSVKGDE